MLLHPNGSPLNLRRRRDRPVVVPLSDAADALRALRAKMPPEVFADFVCLALAAEEDAVFLRAEPDDPSGVGK